MKNKILEILDNEVLPINDKDNELVAQQICDLFDVSNLLLCGMCDKETEHEQISSTALKCLDCGNIAVE